MSAVFIAYAVRDVVFQPGFFFLLKLIPLDALVLNQILFLLLAALVGRADVLPVLLRQTVKVFECGFFLLLFCQFSRLFLLFCLGGCLLPLEFSLNGMFLFKLVCVGRADLLLHGAAPRKVRVDLCGSRIGIEHLALGIGADPHDVNDFAGALTFLVILGG